MSRPPSQNHARVDRQNIQTALDRALSNTSRARKRNARIVECLKELIPLYLADEMPVSTRAS